MLELEPLSAPSGSSLTARPPTPAPVPVIQSSRRLAHRRPYSLPLRPLSLLDAEGRMVSSTSDRHLPYARIVGHHRQSSPRLPVPETPGPAADSTNPMGRIRISRTEDNTLVSEWLPSPRPRPPASSGMDLSVIEETHIID